MDKEQLTIVPLTPDKTDDYLRFFDTAFADTGEWGHLCYCISYCSTPNYDDNTSGFEHAENRRRGAAEYIRKGFLQGYLAYAGEELVAWCNANDRNACLHCFGMRCETYGNERVPEESRERGKSVFCFEVVPHMRKKGVATALLERVLADAARDGYDYVEVYPSKEEKDGAQYYYTGPTDFYTRLGFEQVDETKNYRILRKKL